MAGTDDSKTQAKRGLGRGLSVLMGNLGVDASNAAEDLSRERNEDDVAHPGEHETSAAKERSVEHDEGADRVDPGQHGTAATRLRR